MKKFHAIPGMHNLSLSLLALFTLLTAILLGSCTVPEEDGEDTVTISLSDSLAKYDSIRIVLSSDGKATDSMTLKPPYGPSEGGRLKAVMRPASKPPASFTLTFIVFSGDKPAARYEVKVTEAGASKPVRIDTVGGGGKRPTEVEMITLSPLTLIEKGQPRSIEARVLPADADQGLAWRSLDTSVARVDETGKVTPGTEGETEIVATSKVDGTLSDRIAVKVKAAGAPITGINLVPTRLTLYVGGETGLLKSEFLPVGSASAPVFVSDDTSKAEVAADGRVKPKAAGEVILRAHPEGFPELVARCTLTVVLDKPVLDVGNDRKVSPGQEISFPIKVTQQYGKVAVLRWDLDGDGKYEDSTTEDHAEPKQTYNGSRTEVTVRFYARDTEGNFEEVTRKVLIGSAAPLVEIIRPRVEDTLVNVTPFVVEYLLDGEKKTRSVNLVEGPNPVLITESNEGGTGKDSVLLRLDTKAPVVKITAPVRGLLTREASVAVAWTVDSLVQTARVVESLDGRQGPIVIRREATDPAGNMGFDTLTIFRDIDPPGAPSFTSATTPTPTRNRRPTWHWTGAEGSVRFGVSLGNATPVEGTGNSWSPEPELADGDHVLSVYALDAAGNKGPNATHRIRVQTKGPRVAITSPVNGLVTKASSVAVAWTVDSVAQVTRTSEDLRGKQGLIRILREATDSAGNRVADSIFITRDTIAPPAPPFTAQPPAMVNAAHTAPIQWSWTRHGTASDTFLVVLNGGDPIKLTGTSYTLNNATNQTYHFEVREKDAAGNESEPAKDTVLVDRQAPPSPVVGGVSPAANPVWTWTRGSNSDGNGRFRYRYSTQTTYSAETAVTSFSPTGLASGSHTLLVQERDAAGNWSSDGQAAIVVDRIGPSLAIASPTEFGRVTNVNPTVTGTVTDAQGVVKVEYRLAPSFTYTAVPMPSPGTWTFNASYVDGVNTVWIRGEDALGNKDSISITIHKFPHVIFVKKGMSGTGKSWDDAYGELHQALDTTKVLAAGTEIWVTEGRYNGAPPNGALYLQYGNVKVFGGFPPNRASIDTTGRNFALDATRLSNTLFIGKSSAATNLTNIVIDGFTLKAEPLLPPNPGQVPSAGISANGKIGAVTFRNIKADNMNQTAGTISVIGQRLTLENCEITNAGAWGPVIYMEAVTTMRNVRLHKISSGAQFPFQYTSMLTIEDSHIECFPGAASGHHFLVTTGLTLTINNSKVQFGINGIFRAGPPTAPLGTLNYNANNQTIP